jgi:hypothetical protein
MYKYTMSHSTKHMCRVTTADSKVKSADMIIVINYFIILKPFGKTKAIRELQTGNGYVSNIKLREEVNAWIPQ